jgi:hypothetical protein
MQGSSRRRFGFLADATHGIEWDSMMGARPDAVDFSLLEHFNH